MIKLDRAAAIALGRNILANVPDSYTDEQLNDIGTRAVYWVIRLAAVEPSDEALFERVKRAVVDRIGVPDDALAGSIAKVAIAEVRRVE
jgi:hypothetical protein